MSYGIKQNGSFIFCAKCGRVVSDTGEYSANYCFACGNPLKAEAIMERENEIAEAIKNSK